ncbi:hypothetical protein C6P46_006963 [Rhodotorula mucilaginosa]|uniref:Uncharacterized protein n=1 Tax=Rhodotorula mucilaginosa TaxID=5537 RepID=A0A9P7B307_RHOMI|nr:hypothetical protein C6P46_006963 [Rhodotorula mucilaginosa]
MTANRATALSEVQHVSRPSPAILRASTVDRGLPPLPAHVSIPIAGESNSISTGTERHGSSMSWEDLTLSPPPYRSGPARTPVGPLSFFPFAPMEHITTGDRDTLLLRSRFSHTSSTMAPPPSYAETPRTQAERLFWFGWLFPPFLWLFGASRIWRTENPHGLDLKEEGTLPTALDEAGGAANVRESLELWREEELVWARRCLWALIGSLMLSTLLGVMLASVTGKI